MKFAALVVLLLVPLIGITQQSLTPSSPPETSKDATQDKSSGTYTNTELHLTFSYPQELQPEDAHAIAERGHIAMYGTQPETDPEHVESEACDKVLLMVGKEGDPKRAEITIPGGGKAPSVEPDPTASILLIEIDNSCIPPKILKKPDNALAGLALQTTQIPGMTQIDQPVWYEIQGHKIHFAAAQGRPLSEDGKQLSPDRQIVAGFAIELNGHILFWMLQSDNIDFFNRLLDSKVDFGSGTPQALFPAHLH